MRNYLIHTRDGNKVFSEKEIIDNALSQEAAGVQPVYKWTDYKGHFFPAGWLVWSTYQDGAGQEARQRSPTAGRSHQGKRSSNQTTNTNSRF